ncbi:MAG: hypothetical protein PVSMB1_01500 [Gemmatimonadaceae bacterium]
MRPFGYDRSVSGHDHHAGKTAVGLRSRDGRKVRGGLCSYTRGGKLEQQQEKEPVHSQCLVQIIRAPRGGSEC